jgi:heparosan-N-sulfate-glucuronate 5-epimerase
MAFTNRLHYYRRIFSAYLGSGKSQLTFWHETPAANPRSVTGRLGEYYMMFAEKADYAGHHDDAGIPMLDYRGKIGLQYNPIAIAQWGLANFNRYFSTRDVDAERKLFKAADWLRANLEPNSFGIPVWSHHFDWDYRETLRAPWYSGLAQGQGISLLLRAAAASGKSVYLDSAKQAFESFLHPVPAGGVVFTDDNGNLWFEEYIVDPPTHILNGFIWALWGVYDYSLVFADSDARSLFSRAVATLSRNLAYYDIGFWSLYEQSRTKLPMVASPFYHQLHIVQLRIMCQLTGLSLFAETADRWETYARSRTNRARALAYKSAFKLCYY